MLLIRIHSTGRHSTGADHGCFCCRCCFSPDPSMELPLSSDLASERKKLSACKAHYSVICPTICIKPEMENVDAIACFAQQAPLAWKTQVIRHPRLRLKAVSTRSGIPEALHQMHCQTQLAGAEDDLLCTQNHRAAYWLGLERTSRVISF